ncbi:MAG: ABC transporter ATP-binding protein [Clostridiales bacterium]|nr:ABC transporter ATP-binding protein [Clostridiales bacterium]
MLEVKGLTVAYESGDAVRDVSFTADQGEWIMLIGPNGAGKSTLLAAVAQCAAYRGSVLLESRDARRWKPRAFAQAVGVLAQTHAAGYAFTVEELVTMGRYAHTRGFFRSQDPDGQEAVRRALDMTGLWNLRGRNVQTLSGGELQRAFLAQAMAQEPRVLLLDEPANHLDLVYQKQLFELIGQWMAEGGRCVISVVHDLSLALRYGTRALLLDRGCVTADGPAAAVLASDALRRAYGMDVATWMADMAGRWRAVAAAGSQKGSQDTKAG